MYLFDLLLNCLPVDGVFLFPLFLRGFFVHPNFQQMWLDILLESLAVFPEG